MSLDVLATALVLATTAVAIDEKAGNAPFPFGKQRPRLVLLGSSAT